MVFSLCLNSVILIPTFVCSVVIGTPHHLHSRIAHCGLAEKSIETACQNALSELVPQ